MDDAASIILYRVLPCAMAGALLGYLVLRYINWYIRRLRGAEGRSSEINAYLNAVEQREWQPNIGGTMGFPFMRCGKESLRIEPRGDCLQIIRRRDENVIARLEVDDPIIADHIFGLMARHLEKAVPESGEPVPVKESCADGDAQEVLLQFRDGRRQLFLLRSRGCIKVADVRSGKIHGAAVVNTEAEGRELFAALSCKDAAQLAKHRQQMQKMHAEPLVAGAKNDPASGLSTQPIDSYSEDQDADQEFTQRFS